MIIFSTLGSIWKDFKFKSLLPSWLYSSRSKTSDILLEKTMASQSWFDKISNGWVGLSLISKISVFAGVTLCFGLLGMTAGVPGLFFVTAFASFLGIHYLLTLHHADRLENIIKEPQKPSQHQENNSNPGCSEENTIVQTLEDNESLPEHLRIKKSESVVAIATGSKKHDLSKRGAILSGEMKKQSRVSMIVFLQNRFFIEQERRINKHQYAIKRHIAEIPIIPDAKSTPYDRFALTRLFSKEKNEVPRVDSYVFEISIAEARLLYYKVTGHPFSHPIFDNSEEIEDRLIRMTLTKKGTASNSKSELIQRDKKAVKPSNELSVRLPYENDESVWGIKFETTNANQGKQKPSVHDPKDHLARSQYDEIRKIEENRSQRKLALDRYRANKQSAGSELKMEGLQEQHFAP